MSTTGTTAKQKLTAKIKAMPTGMMMQALDTLGAKTDREEAETIVLLAMTTEYRHRLEALAKVTTTEALLKDYRDLEALDYATLPTTKNALYWVIDTELQRRFPKATEAVEAWLDGIDHRTTDTSYAAKFMALIEEHKA
jgi:hypothetical protein